VGICVGRRIEMVVGLLGIMKAGAAYVPLDPKYPKERLEYTLKDAAVKALLTEEGLKEVFAERVSERIRLDSDWPLIAEEGDQNPCRKALPENLAYIIYTSGSTGKPKGVAITHRSAVTLAQWAGEVFSEEELKGALASTSICFDLSVFELMVPLSLGGKVVLADNALSLPELKAAQEVRLINTVPSAIRELVGRNGIPESVETVNLAGEVLRNDLAQQIYGRGKVRRVLNLYGPTEDTTYSTWTMVSRGGSEEPTLGRPIANTAVYILDPEMRPEPVGIYGEIYITGEGLARCYWNRPEITGEKFLPNPYGKRSGERLYRTGDVGRYVRDGEIEYRGREDHQVKVRGYRIELGEIERTLEQSGWIREAVVVVREEVPGDKRLVGYVVIDGGEEEEKEPKRLRNYLKEKLPDYMIPSAIVALEKMPLTANGKLDRKALPRPWQEPVKSEASFIPPRTLIEEMVAGLFEEVLGLDRVGIHDNFFEMGGHSLLATQVVSRVRKVFGVEIGVKSVFEEENVEGLARRVEAAMRDGEKVETPLDYWKKQLGSLPLTLNLPAVHPRPSASSRRGEAILFTLPAELDQSLRVLSRREGVTLSMVFLAALKTLLYRYSAQEDIIVGATVAKRVQAEAESLIDPLVNMLPLRTDLGGNPRFSELLRRVRKVALDGSIYQDLPIEKLIEEIHPQSASKEMPLFNVAFGMQNAQRDDLRMNGVEIEPVDTEQEMARFDLELWVTKGTEGAQARWIYRKDMFEKEAVIRMHRHFEALLFSIVDRPDARLLNLRVSPGVEPDLSNKEQDYMEDSDVRKLMSVKRKGINLPTD